MRKVIEEQSWLGSVDIGLIELDAKSGDDIPAILIGFQAIWNGEAECEELFQLPDAHIPPRQRRDMGRLNALFAEKRRVGNGWIPINGTERDYATALAVWLNSTPGRIAIMGGRDRKLGFPNYSAKHFGSVPAPTKGAEASIEGLAEAYGQTKQLQVGQFREGSGEVRIAWDEAVVECVLGEEWRDRINALRADLDSDPYVQGTELPEASL